MLLSAGLVSSESEGAAAIEETLSNGEALNKFQKMLIAQGVETAVAEKLCTSGGKHDWEVRAHPGSSMTGGEGISGESKTGR